MYWNEKLQKIHHLFPVETRIVRNKNPDLTAIYDRKEPSRNEINLSREYFIKLT
jgi:hypothetical protein